jgi:hypothetical protein
VEKEQAEMFAKQAGLSLSDYGRGRLLQIEEREDVHEEIAERQDQFDSRLEAVDTRVRRLEALAEGSDY